MGDDEEQRRTFDALIAAIDADRLLGPPAVPLMRLVVLDTGPLGLISHPRSRPRNDQCRQWVNDLATAGVHIFVPEIADYEVRRELLRVGATAGLRRLDQVKATLDYAALTTAVILRAAELSGSRARRAGRPTAPPEAVLDGDCLLAARACWRPDQATW